MATRRLVALDALRAIAVLLVLGRHVIDPDTGMPDALARVLDAWHEFGWFGVDLFFVLSGFLVSGLLFHEYQKYGEIQPLRFLGRRGLKIYPGFYVLFLFTIVWQGRAASISQYVSEAVFTQNYFGHVWNHTWSLAVEEHFYIGLVVLLFFTTRRRSGPDPFRWLPAFTLAVAITVLALRTLRYLRAPGGMLLLPTHLRIDALLFGVLLSYAWSFHRSWIEAFVERWRWLIAGGSLALLIPSLAIPVKDSFVVNTIGLTMNYVGFGGIVLLAVMLGERARAFNTVASPLARMGFYSYSIYLWHMPVSHMCKTYVTPRLGNPASVAIYFVAAIVVGIAAAKLIEVPVLKLRDRWLPSRVASAT